MKLPTVLRSPETEEGGPAPVPSPSEQEAPEFSTVEELLNFDPFAEAPEAESAKAPPAPPARQAPPASRAPASDPAPAVDPGIPAQVPEAPHPAVPSSDELALRNEVARLAGIVEGYTRAVPQQPAAPPTSPKDDPFPSYEFNIPDQLMMAFASENPLERKNALQQFSRGLALGIHAMMRQEYRKAIVDAVPPMIEQAMTGQTLMRQVFDDFYGTHRDLNRPELRPMIVEIAQRVWHGGQFGRNWNPQMRDAVANEARAILRGYTPPQAPARQPQPAMAPTAARPPVDGRLTDPNAPENIERTLFG